MEKDIGESEYKSGFAKKPAVKTAFYIFAFLAAVLLSAYFAAPYMLNAFYNDDAEEKSDEDLLFSANEILEEENMYFDLAKLKDAVYVPENRLLMDFLKSGSWSEEDVSGILEKNSLAFDHFDSAVEKQKYANPVFTGKDIEEEEEFSIMPWNNISYLSGVKAIRLANLGEKEAALEQAVKPIIAGGAIMSAETSIIEYLGAITLQRSGLDALKEVIALTSPSSEELAAYKAILDENNITGNGSFFKYEYTEGRHFIDAVFQDIIPEEFLKQTAAYGLAEYAGSYYFKKNQTKNVRADHYRGQINYFLSPCDEAVDAGLKKAAEIKKNSVISPIKFKFTENAAGKQLNQASLIDLAGNLKEKRCGLESKFAETAAMMD